MNTENNTFTQAEVEQFRVKLMALGKYYGMQAVCPMADNIDPKYKQRKAEGSNNLIKPVDKFFTEVVDLIKFDPIRLANGTLAIMINGRTDLQFPLVGEMPRLVSSDPNDIHEAIRRYKDEGKISFFSNRRIVTEIVVEMNRANAAFLRERAEEFLNQANSLDTLCKIETDKTESYYRSLENAQ